MKRLPSMKHTGRKGAETAEGDRLIFDIGWLLHIRTLKFNSDSKHVIVEVTENYGFLRKTENCRA